MCAGGDKKDFVDSWVTVGGTGDPENRHGLAIHLYGPGLLRAHAAVAFVMDCFIVSPRAWAPSALTGYARNTWYRYSCNAPMENKAFYNSDGDLLIVPQLGALRSVRSANRRCADELSTCRAASAAPKRAEKCLCPTCVLPDVI